ncbi:hypothetical protein [Tateyamaria pelophila]|uniref:hypothetical protein n=1 Tax=Tateyamaria pelophila TaxID=328415 RepID=UPI001CBE9568|nr:hypothetical protein [Tateyamaria pelophila]
MTIRSTLLAIALSAFVIPAFADPSSQHSEQALQHSSQAVGHGSAAIATGTASIVAVPIVAAGSVIAVTGSALESIGTGAIDAGVELSTFGTLSVNGGDTVTPNAAPTLD